MPEDLLAVGTHLCPAAGRAHTTRATLQRHMIAVQALQFGVEVLRQRALLRGELQSIGKRVVPLGKQSLPIVAAPSLPNYRLKAVLQVVAQPQQQGFVSLRMQPVHTVQLLLVFDQSQPPFPRLRSKKQDTDVDPFVPHQIRRIAQDAVGKDALVRRGDRKSTRLNSSHSQISYAVFCLEKSRGLPWPRRPSR